MAYIGRGTDKLSNIEKLDTITFDGSSSYTLQKNSVNFVPNSANSLQVSIDGVVQAGNFTVSGSTIDFGVAIPSTSTCDFIFHYGTGLITTPADGTVGLAQLSATGTKDSTTFLRGDNTFAEPAGGGITQADQWRLTANTGNGTNDYITANWENVDDAQYSTLGDGITESSGTFSFPETGYYLVSVNAHLGLTNGDAGGIDTYVTTDNSSYDQVARAFDRNSGSSSDDDFNCSSQVLVDVTNTTNVKVKFATNSMGASSYVKGETNFNYSYVTFIRLGDT